MNSFRVIRSSLYVLLLDIVLSVESSVLVLLITRWQVSAIPGFEYIVLKLIASSAVASLIADIVCEVYKIVIRYTDIRSVSKLILSDAVKQILLFVALKFIVFDKSLTHLSGIFIAFDFVLTFFFLIVARLIIVYVFDVMSDDMEMNVKRHSVLIYGISDKSAAIAKRLEQSSTYIVCGYISSNKSDDGLIVMNKKIFYAPTLEQLSNLKVSLGVEGIIFAKDTESDAEKDKLIPMALKCGIHIFSAPRIEELKYDGLSGDTIKQVMDNDFIPDGMTSFERQLKRLTDLFLSAILIVVFSIPMLICAILVRLRGGKGPVIYRQERVGRFGRPFIIYKFRTMRDDAESGGEALYQGDEDPRLTKIGKFLRVHHLDEMPQLFNVLKGDMAFVGYRPERKFYIDQIMEKDPRYYYLYQIRPGVTSYATLRNGYADTLDKMLRRLEFDLYYLRHRSAFFDIRILFQTFMNIIFGKKF